MVHHVVCNAVHSKLVIKNLKPKKFIKYSIHALVSCDLPKPILNTLITFRKETPTKTLDSIKKRRAVLFSLGYTARFIRTTGTLMFMNVSLFLLKHSKFQS